MRTIPVGEQKKICLEILKFLHNFCKENHLRMYLAYGSLIGAIRHKGFIPWDDDIDVMMPRADYELLIKSFPEHPYYKLLYLGNDKTYTKPFATLNDTRTYKEEYTIRKKYRNNLCLNVDIFPFDAFPDSLKEQNLFIEEIKQRLRVLQCFTWKYSKGKTIKSTLLKNMGITWIRLLEFFKITSLPSYLEKYEKFITKYNSFKTLVCGCGEDVYSKGMILPIDIFEEHIEVDFEGNKFFAPLKYHLVLTTQYGDYMKLPPKEDRVPHHLCKCYWRDESII